MNPIFTDAASRISTMIPRNPEQEVIYTFLFGALYALARAELLRYPEEGSDPGKSASRAEEVKELAAEMVSKVQLPKDGEWLGGFYFNDAVFRLGICVEHVVRHITGLKGRETLNVVIKVAESKGFDVKKILPGWEISKDEVDSLRHKSWDYLEGPKMQYSEALKLMENLVEFVDLVFKNPSWSD